jgi:putative flippase GtrA
MMKTTHRQLIRFVVVGFINTLNYYILYLLFIHGLKFNYLLSHLLAFVLSMMGSFFMNTYFTYHTKPTLKKFLQFPFTYLVNITVTTVSIYIFVDICGFDQHISPLLASLIAIPFTFLVSKKILLSSSK